ncbi:hypothetical protein [Fluviicola sp.]|uniref:hypothetical protein n=1 Tax=Fluviicola sp. TaxID=1917219 RepID=UPI003D2D2706
MKLTSVIIGILCSSVLFAQQPQERTPGTEEVFGNEQPVPVRDASEAVAVINSIRMGMKTATKETNPKRVYSEADYLTLTTKADDFMIQQKYDAAIQLYKEILKEREDSYAKDRILEAEALIEKQQKEEEIRKKDKMLYEKAELASSNKLDKHTVHFTGALMSDVSSSKYWTSEAFNRKDPYSDFLQEGRYNDIAHDLQKSTDFTLDGIAIPANTRLIVYEKPNFTGEILLDVTGPAIVNNGYRISNKRFKELSSKQFYDALQSNFPQSVRSWSKTNMHTWLNGSMEIKTANEE